MDLSASCEAIAWSRLPDSSARCSRPWGEPCEVTNGCSHALPVQARPVTRRRLAVDRPPSPESRLRSVGGAMAAWVALAGGGRDRSLELGQGRPGRVTAGTTLSGE